MDKGTQSTTKKTGYIWLSGLLALIFGVVAFSDLGLERIRIPAAIVAGASLLAWLLLSYDNRKQD